MTQAAWLLFAAAIVFAAVDWFAVARANLRLRWVFKPGTILLLVGVALALHPASNAQRYVFIAAALLSFAGDALLLAGERGFRAGLGAFLAAHLAYGAGFLIGGVRPGLLTLVAPAVAILSLALGGRTFKLKFGHRGVNQPVKDVESGRVEITSHNHGFAVDPEGWPGTRATHVVETTAGRAALTHWNLNDGTLEGLRCLEVPAFSVQFHPEARKDQVLAWWEGEDDLPRPLAEVVRELAAKLDGWQQLGRALCTSFLDAAAS